MNIFLIGSRGHLGRHLKHDLLSHGHMVQSLPDYTLSPLPRTRYLETIKTAVIAADATVHLWDNTLSDTTVGDHFDTAVFAAISDALTDITKVPGRNKLLVTSSGTAIGAGAYGTLTEDTAVPLLDTHELPAYPPLQSESAEDTALALAERGVRTGIIRTPPFMHGGDMCVPADPFLLQILRGFKNTGAAHIAGKGGALWPAAHVADVARVYRLALERMRRGQCGDEIRRSPGKVARFHAVGEYVTPADLGALAALQLELPLVGVGVREAAAVGSWAGVLARPYPAVCGLKTRERLGWAPERQGLIAMLEQGEYWDQV